MSMLNRTTRLHNFADAGVQIQRRRCSISAAEALNFNAVCTNGLSMRFFGLFNACAKRAEACRIVLAA